MYCETYKEQLKAFVFVEVFLLLGLVISIKFCILTKMRNVHNRGVLVVEESVRRGLIVKCRIDCNYFGHKNVY